MRHRATYRCALSQLEASVGDSNPGHLRVLRSFDESFTPHRMATLSRNQAYVPQFW